MTENWRERAACRGGDPDLHFPTGTSGPALVQTAEAKAVCRGCSVINDCLRDALDNNIHFGIFGGMTEEERVNLKRRRATARSRENAAAKRQAEITAFESEAVA